MIIQSSKRYPPVNRCIYCLDEKGPFGDEHIVPFGLGGRLVLPKSSCKSCENQTRRIEEVCLREIIGPIRYRMGLGRKKKHRDRPSTKKMTVIDSDGTRTTLNVPVEHVHDFVVFPKLPPPGILSGVEKQKYYVGSIWSMFQYKPDDGKEFEMKARLHIGFFMQMLAKIAHAYAVAELGIGAFTPYLNSFIQSVPIISQNFVGGSLAKTEPPEKLVCMLSLKKWQELPEPNKCYLVADIRLLSNLGTPWYQVVVGELHRV